MVAVLRAINSFALFETSSLLAKPWITRFKKEMQFYSPPELQGNSSGAWIIHQTLLNLHYSLGPERVSALMANVSSIETKKDVP